MEPLQVFQGLMVAIAAALVTELKGTSRLRKAALIAAIISLGLVAIFAQKIAEAFPKVGTAMGDLGGHPVTWFVLIIAIYSWLRPRWVKTPAQATAIAIPDFVISLRNEAQELRTRIESLERLQSGGLEDANRISQHARLSTDLGEARAEIRSIKKDLERLGPLADAAEKEQHEKTASFALDRVAAMKRPKPIKKANPINGYGIRSEVGESLHPLLYALGATHEEMQNALKATEQRVTTNSLYCTIQPDEADVWLNPEQKQSWHLREATAAAYEAIIKRHAKWRRGIRKDGMKSEPAE